MVRLSQAEVGVTVGLDRTAITRLEKGERKLDSLELVRIAAALRRPVEWFLSPPLPAVVSRRASRAPVDESQADAILDGLARDVQLLFELNLLVAAPPARKRVIDSVESAEAAANDLRLHLALPPGPVWNLVANAERVGLYCFCLPLADEIIDGSFLRLDDAGVALINGSNQPGRRRFTLVHELGHHVFEDDYSPEWILGSGHEEREKLINAFAIHFLMPRPSVVARWLELDGPKDPRQAALVLGAEYGVSWTALLGHLANLQFINEHAHKVLLNARPTKVDYLEAGVSVREEIVSPTVPPKYGQAVIRAFKRHKISHDRAIQLLQGTASGEDLPEPDDIPREAMRSQFDLA